MKKDLAATVENVVNKVNEAVVKEEPETDSETATEIDDNENSAAAAAVSGEWEVYVYSYFLLTLIFIQQNLSKLKQQWLMEAVPNQQVNNSSQTVAAEKSQQTATHVTPAPSHSPNCVI